jgi:hypothetical protein
VATQHASATTRNVRSADIRTSPSSTSDDSDDSDKEEDDPPMNNPWFSPRVPLPSAYFRAPKSTEECSRTYNTIQTALETDLNDRYEEFGVYLLVGCYGVPGSTVEIPFLFVGVPKERDLPAMHTFPSAVRDCGLTIVICHVATKMDLTENTNRALPRRNLCTGLSVGNHRNKDSTTLGAIIKKSDGTYMGVTSGHLIERGQPGDIITQPSQRNFAYQLESLDKDVTRYEKRIQAARTSAERDVNTIAQGKVEQTIKSVKQFVRDTATETQAKLKAGITVAREFKTVQAEHGRKISDYLLFDIDASRNPGMDKWDFAPPTRGVLGG